MSLMNREMKRKKQKKNKFGLAGSLLILVFLLCLVKMDLPLEKHTVSEETTMEILESENIGDVEDDDSKNGGQKPIDTLEKENACNEMEETANTAKKEKASLKLKDSTAFYHNTGSIDGKFFRDTGRGNNQNGIVGISGWRSGIF